MKIVLKGLSGIAVFFAMIYALSSVPWMQIFEVDKNKARIEESLGNLFWEQFKNMGDEITDEELTAPVIAIVDKLCEDNEIAREDIKPHLLKMGMMNAFALPDGHLVISTELIKEVENAQALSGVIAHELAHIEEGHIMKKLVKEIGLGVLVGLTSGGANPEVIREVVSSITSSAFDRSLEKEADLKAVEYLHASKINPEDFAEFMYQLSSQEEFSSGALKWLRTHPVSEERAKYILDAASLEKVDYEAIMDEDEWQQLQDQF